MFLNETREFKLKYEPLSNATASSRVVPDKSKNSTANHEDGDADVAGVSEAPNMQTLTADALRIYLDYVPQGSPNQVRIRCSSLLVALDALCLACVSHHK